MKKLISLLIISMVLLVSACAATAPVYELGVISETWRPYEHTVYDVERYYYLSEDQSTNAALAGKIVTDETNSKIIIGRGVLTYIITSSESTFTVEQSQTFTYVGEDEYTKEILGAAEYARYRRFMGTESSPYFGKTDTRSTTFVGSSTAAASFSPVSITSTVDQQSTGDKFNYSYNYTTREFSYNLNDTGNERTYKASKVANVYDNEQMLLFFRLLRPSTFIPGSSVTLNNVTSWEENMLNTVKNKSADPLKFSFTGTAAEQNVDLSIPALANLVDQADGNPVTTFTTLKVTLTNTSSDRKGPSIIAYYETNGAIKNGINNSARLLMRTAQYTYDTLGGNNALVQSTEFNISAIFYSIPA